MKLYFVEYLRRNIQKYTESSDEKLQKIMTNIQYLNLLDLFKLYFKEIYYQYIVYTILFLLKLLNSITVYW